MGCSRERQPQNSVFDLKRTDMPHNQANVNIGQGELDFGFLGRERCLAAFQDVLFAGTSGLNHLVNGPLTPSNQLVRKAKGEVIDNLRFLERNEPLIVTMRGRKLSSFILRDWG